MLAVDRGLEFRTIVHWREERLRLVKGGGLLCFNLSIDPFGPNRELAL